MNNSYRIEYAAQTDTGLVREHNEDAIALCPANHLTILADGMGGYNAGEVASQMAISVISDYIRDNFSVFVSQLKPYPAEDLLEIVSSAVHHANNVILTAALSEPSYLGMGTTVVVTLCDHDRIVVAHVGDSRAYRYRHGKFTQITRDHSVVQEQLDAGSIRADSVAVDQLRNLLTRAVGVAYLINVEVNLHQLEAGDIYLLCSDGLSDMLKDQQIEAMLRKDELSLQEICDALVAQANLAGGRDNISVIVFRVNQIKNTGLTSLF